MRTNVTFSEIVNQVYNIFSDDRRVTAYTSDGGELFDMFRGWAGPMSPANRAAFVQTFGRDVTDRAEAEARARVDEYRAAVAASAYHRHELEADAFASYGGSEKSQFPDVGAFVWGRWSCMKGEGGPVGELEDLERMDQEGRENPRRLCEVVAVVDAEPGAFLDRDFADGVARQFQELGGSRYEETDPRHLDGCPMSWELVFCVRCAGRWYMIDGQGYEYSRYFLMPEDFRQMYAPELATITAAREDEERRQQEEEQRQAEARRADYLKRCARWAPLMEDVRPLMEAERAAYGSREKSQIRKASAKLAAARRRNLVAMASALYPGVKFSAKKWDGWGGSYELEWTDGPTEEHLQEAADFDLFESGRDTFDGMTDYAGHSYAEFTDFSCKYFGLFGQIRMNRHHSEEFRQSIRQSIRAAVPGLPEGDQERITAGDQQGAICGMFPDVCASYIVQNLERYGLRDAVAYIARCIDATPTQEDEPTDPNGGGSPTPSYGDREKSQNPDAPTVEGVEVVGYSEKALAVFGDTRALADELKTIGAKFNRALTYNGERRAGWIISRRKADELAALLAVPQETEQEADGAAAPALPEPPAAVVYDPAQPIDHAEFVAVDADGAPYGDCEKSQLQEVDEWGRTAETQAINAALVVVPAHVMRDFGFVADSGAIVTNTGTACLLHPSRGFVCMPDDGGTPYTPAGGADALAEILQAGGFLNFDGFRFVWPIEHDADSIRRVLAAYGVCEKSQTQDTMRAEAQREEVRDWYMFQYPTDEEGANIQAGATFADIMADPARVYDYIPGDSIIRERVFRETANRYGVEYSDIYTRWMDEEETASETPQCDVSTGAAYGETEKSLISARLEEIRAAIVDESASYEQIVYLQEHAEYIDPADTQLLEWAGVPEADGVAYGETEKSLSEVLEAHQRIKEKHPRGVILYEVGDYYAAAFTDAEDVAKAVEVVSVENDPIGFPFVKFRTFWLSDVLPSILAAGLKVNIVGKSKNAASIADAIKGAA